MKFNERLKELRKAAGLTQAQLARLSGVSYSYLTKLEGGYQDNPTREILEAIGAVLNVPLSAIYDFGDIIDKKKPSANSEELLKTNTVHIVGRDGTNITKTLTDEQIRMLQTMIDALPEADDL